MKQDDVQIKGVEDYQINLAAASIGAKVLYASDDFFAEKENLIQAGRGLFIADKYTERGKWMDGWESRRKRTPGHDLAVIRLGYRGEIDLIDIDTNHFLGNHPPQASIEAYLGDEDPDDSAAWVEILGKVPLKPGCQNLYPIGSDLPWSHLRLNIYPDGGVARLKVYGRVGVDWLEKREDVIEDLVSLENGGQVMTCNDKFFSPGQNLMMPGRGKNMADGWETRRRREPGNDWIILALGRRGRVYEILVDTNHFKGNYPDSVSIEAIDGKNTDWKDPKIAWKTLLPQQKLMAHQEHRYGTEVADLGPITHVRMNIFPDGGISRLRLYGRFDLGRTLNQMPETELEVELARCCQSTSWVKAMVASRPFDNSDDLFHKALMLWRKMGESDVLEAFSGHPMIGDRHQLAERFQQTASWASGEQEGIREASETAIDELMQLNQTYHDRFGFIFIICATGKSAMEMLNVLKARITKTRAEELALAAAEQAKITRLRLAKLI